MRRYKLPWYKRKHDRLKILIQRIVWGVLCLITLYGFWYSLQSHRRHEQASLFLSEAALQAAKKEKEVQDLYDVLNGRKQMLEFAGKYLIIERVTWELDESRKVKNAIR